jgi:undecaprenyl-diphosphatase
LQPYREEAGISLSYFLGIDLWLFHLVNGWSGHWELLDWLVLFGERNNLFKGAAIMAAYWWLWFSHEPRQLTRRNLLLALLGAIVSLIVARALASSLPFRVRPMYSPDLDYQAPYLPRGARPFVFENWSSFPSDNAALFFALSLGLWRCSRLLGAVAMAFAAIWVCLARIYVGIHYPSDIVIGIAVGIVCTYAMMKLGTERMGNAVLSFEQDHPSWFYAAMFLVTFEFAFLFDDVRQFMRGALLALRALGMQSIGPMGALVIGAGALSISTVAIAFGLSWFRKVIHAESDMEQRQPPTGLAVQASSPASTSNAGRGRAGR